MRKIKKGDNVVVIAGRDKGKRGDVTQVVDDEHVVVAGINQVKRHTRPNPMKNQQGGSSPRRRRSTFPMSRSGTRSH
jgi:large subunit ribosomal protein L24